MRSIPQVLPKYLSLITTYRCTASCPNCCFNCSPNPTNKAMMTYEEICRYIDLTKTAFPNIAMVVFTGGECTLLGDVLFKSINYAYNNGLKTRIVTNACWATNEKRAKSILDEFADAGLTEINFSTGDEHVEYVPESNIVRALRLSAQNEKLSSAAVNIESLPNSSIRASTLKNNEELLSLPTEQRKKLSFLQSSWIEFRYKHPDNNQNRDALNLTYKRGCPSILDTITINPNGQFLSCCGLSSEYSPFLKLGKVFDNIKELNDNRYKDILKLWMYIDGPYNILKSIGAEIPQKNKHICEYCYYLLSNKENVEKLLNIDKNRVEQILLNYSLKLKKHEHK